jgi:hypothetical protein
MNHHEANQTHGSNARRRWRTATYALGTLVVGAATLLVVERVRAAGIPAENALTYTGYLETPEGEPVDGSRNIGLSVYARVSGGTPVCEVAPDAVEVLAGRFQLALPDECTDQVKASPDLWIQVEVDGESLGRTKLGAVPYAVEAGHATTADRATVADSVAGGHPAVLGAGWGSPYCSTAPGSLELSVSGTAMASASHAYGPILQTRSGAFTIGLDGMGCSTGPNVCGAPVTFFLVSPMAQTLSLQVYTDNAGAVYLNGLPSVTVPNGGGTVSVAVPQGSFALSFLACSNDGPSLALDVFNQFITEHNLTIDEDRTYHRNGQ